MVDSTITHHPKQQLTPLGQYPTFYLLGEVFVWYGTSLWPP